MGTHPIFESDFDCLTEMSERGGGLGSSGLKPPSKIRPPARAGDGPADTFKVGDRVRAAGKRGVIAFLGDTEFASGHWAGIVLDDPVGKNDGMVAGVRYFQTEDKRGVFIRPAKLEVDLASTTSPIPKSTSRTSISEAPLPSPTEKSLKVGEHVIYNGKTGIVRFVGPTDFKDGVWVGIELHEPSGKNDGSVLGKYYFNCPPKFGLFAMPHKVQRIKKIPGSPSIGTRSIRGRTSPGGSVSSFGSMASTNSVAIARAQAAEAERMRARANACNVNEIKKALDEKEKQVASMLTERDMQQDELVRVSAQIMELTNRIDELENELSDEKEIRIEAENKLEELEFKMAENEVGSGPKTPKAAEGDDEDDLEEFPDGNDKDYLLGEIEDLKQQLVDLQEEKQFAEAELHENLSFEKEQNKQLRSELEAQKTESANNVAELSGGIEKLKEQIQAAGEGKSEEVTEALAKLESEKEKLEQLEFELEEERGTRKEVEAQLSDFVRNYEGEKQDLCESKLKLEGQVKQLEETNSNLSSELEIAKAKGTTDADNVN